MRRSRLVSVFLAALVLASVLAGCGGSKPTQPAQPAAPAPAQPSTPAPAAKPAEPKPTNLVVYGAIHEYEISRLLDKFSETTGIKTEFIRASSGQIAARVMAEKGAPKGDIILGGPSETHEALLPDGLLRAYKSPTAKDIDARYMHPEGYWSGFYVGALGIAVNPARFEKEFKGEKMPETWDDLLNPKFAKTLSIAMPGSSGTSYNFVATQIFRFGGDEAKAWDFLTKLHPNVAQYTTSGSAPAKQVAAGEFTFGMAFGHDIMKPMQAGYKMKLIYPKQTGWEIGAVSIIKGGPNPKAAEMFVDWMLGKDAGQIHTDLSLRISVRKDVKLPPGAITLDKIDLVKYDNKWAGANRKRIVSEWNNRFSK